MLLLEIENGLRLCGLNVCGLKSKINLGILGDYIRHFDFVCLSETKAKNLPDDELPGFTYLEKKNYERHTKLGGTHGLGMLMRNTLLSLVDVIDNEECCTHVFWVKVQKVLGEAFLLGSVYVPYEGSIHYNCHWSDELAGNVSYLTSHYNLPVILLGDFNAR